MATTTNISDGVIAPNPEAKRAMDVNIAGGTSAPASKTQIITKSDVTVYDPMIKAFRVSTTAGNVSVTDAEGNTTIILAVQLYETIHGLYTKINSTGTTAVGIMAFI